MTFTVHSKYTNFLHVTYACSPFPPLDQHVTSPQIILVYKLLPFLPELVSTRSTLMSESAILHRYPCGNLVALLADLSIQIRTLANSSFMNYTE
jgi:hypothetical protein